MAVVEQRLEAARTPDRDGAAGQVDDPPDPGLGRQLEESVCPVDGVGSLPTSTVR
jgi:hypothetical protein